MTTETSFTIVDTVDLVASFIDGIPIYQTKSPVLYVDLEGVNLCRHGSVSIVQILVSSTITHVYLVDVHVLGLSAFTTPGTYGRNLKTILEDSTIVKAFFDVRNDSDALFSHYGINLDGIVDIQLLEVATRAFDRKFVSGLGKCIEQSVKMSTTERAAWKVNKDQVVGLFSPDKGGSYEVFNKRPIPVEILSYCVQDVIFLPGLWNLYDSRLGESWRQRVCIATTARIRDSQSTSYIPNGRHKALSPWH